MKKTYLLSLIALFAIELGYSQPILPGIFGQNANRTYVIGVHTAGGDLDKYWDDVLYPGQNYTKESKGKFMRYGGIPLDEWGLIDGNPTQGNPNPSDLYLTIQDYISKAKIIQDNGMTPMMTLPLNLTLPAPAPQTFAQAAAMVAELVKGVNDGLVAAGVPYTPVLYWIYSNEPEEGGGIHGYANTVAGAKRIHDYIAAYYNAIYGTGNTCWDAAWGTPVFVGPELYNFDNYDHSVPIGSGNALNRLIDQLTGQWIDPHNDPLTGNPIGSCDITPYVNIFTVHYYPFGSEAKYAGYQPDPTRDNVVKILTQDVPPADQGATYMIKSLEWEITNLQGKLPANIKVGITEANICYQNEVTPPDPLYNYTMGNPNVPTNQTVDGPTGNTTNGFIAGQFWAEMMAVCMKNGVEHLNFWSSLEGYPGDIANPTADELTYRRNKTNLGYIDDVTFQKKSTYHHFKMMAENFKGTFLSNLNTASIANTKTFAYQNGNEVGILIMNQNQTSPSSVNTFSINFDNTDPTWGDIKIKLNISPVPTNATSYGCAIRSESTVLLRFNATTGDIIDRTEYSIEDAMNNAAPKTWDPSTITTADAYIRDTPDDAGNTPFHLCPPPAGDGPWLIVDGTDVWVRNSAENKISAPGTPDRYNNEHNHESPEFKLGWLNNPPTSTDVPHIYVKVRNRGCTQVSGDVHLYYQNNFTTNDLWEDCSNGSINTCGSWRELLCGDVNGDEQIDGAETQCAFSINLNPGEEGVIDAPWTSVHTFYTAQPSQNLHDEHCLVARFVSSADQINEDVQEPTTQHHVGAGNDCSGAPIISGQSAAFNAARSNNITQKNVWIVNQTLNNFTCGPYNVHFGNVSEKQSVNKLELVDVSSAFTGTNGRVTIDLGKTLYDAWVKGGKKGSGIADDRDKYNHMSSTGVLHNHAHLSPDANPYEVTLTSSTATLENISLPAHEMQPIGTYLNYYSGSGVNTSFKYQFRQYESFNLSQPNYNFTGAANLHFTHPVCPAVDAGADKNIGRDCSTQLQASPVTPGAVYIWRNNSTGAFVDSGSTITVSPYVTTSYELEIRLPNCCIGYDVVTVSVAPKQSCLIVSCPVIDFKNKILHQPELIKNREVVVSGYLRVPAGVTLRIESSKLNFQKNASLEVMPGGRLEIIDGQLRGCNPFDGWKGISATGNNTDNSQIKISGSSIRDAVSPISAQMVTGFTIENSTIEYGTNGIELVNSKNFTVRGNKFYGQDIAIKTSGTFVGTGSIIEKNYFSGNKSALNFNNDNHSKLVIKCDTFETYTDYAVYSNNSTLKDQGTLSEGAGNVFISSSVQVNNKLHHNGNTMKYYYDPSNPVSLTAGSGMTATAQAATTDAACIVAATSARLANVSADNSVEAGVIRGKEIEFKAYPNPFNDQLTILYNLPANCKAGTLKIYEAASGKEVVSSVLIAGENKLVLENINIAPGMYLCRILTDDGTSKQFKLVNIK